jgi:hypothetical protein
MQGIVLGIAILLCRFFPHRRSLVQGGFAVVPLLGAALLQVCPFEKRWSLEVRCGCVSVIGEITGLRNQRHAIIH